MQPEDRALLISVVLSVLVSAGGYLSGHAEYAFVGGLILAIGLGLKAVLKPTAPAAAAP